MVGQAFFNDPDDKTLSPSVMVLSTVQSAGKTTLISGLVRAFFANKKRILGVKPYELGTHRPMSGLGHFSEIGLGLGLPNSSTQSVRTASAASSDQEEMDYRTGQANGMSPLVLPNAAALTKSQWHLLLDTCQQLPYPSLIEGPGILSTPWGCVDDVWKTALDVAGDLNYPVLLVTPKSVQVMDHVLPAVALCRDRGVDVLGWASVETRPMNADDTLLWQALSVALYPETQIPHLGTVPWMNTPLPVGDMLGRVIEDAIDLLPLQYVLDDGVGWHARGNVQMTEIEGRY